MARVGQEVVFRVRSTPKGCKVVEFDGRGLAEGYMTKNQRQYFYGEDANEKATQYAERLVEKYENARVVDLGERL